MSGKSRVGVEVSGEQRWEGGENEKKFGKKENIPLNWGTILRKRGIRFCYSGGKM